MGEIFSTFFNLVTTIQYTDIIDIALVAFLIYKILTFVRKTNSGNVVKSMILILAALWLSSLLKLNVISWLLGKAFEMGILVIIILFQPELRRLLEQLGGSDFAGMFAGKTVGAAKATEYAITQVVAACSDMARDKVGALIVFERKANLDGYIKTGTLVDASPASELVRNIFYPKSPLHDGAMIIRDGRIASAACMLPLSNNNNLSRDLGMRHRAGVGMSERTDAVVIIVSEETGAISVAIDSMLKRHLAPDTFDKLLRNELLPQTDTKKRRFFRRTDKQSGEME